MQTTEREVTHRKTDEPYGNRELNNARRYAHIVFDALWTSRYQRTKAYEWLALHMAMTDAECHIALMSLQQCQEVVRLVRELAPTIPDRDPSEKRFERKRRGLVENR
jgi:hypothetical protein